MCRFRNETRCTGRMRAGEELTRSLTKVMDGADSGPPLIWIFDRIEILK